MNLGQQKGIIRKRRWWKIQSGAKSWISSLTTASSQCLCWACWMSQDSCMEINSQSSPCEAGRRWDFICMLFPVSCFLLGNVWSLGRYLPHFLVASCGSFSSWNNHEARLRKTPDGLKCVFPSCQGMAGLAKKSGHIRLVSLVALSRPRGRIWHPQSLLAAPDGVKMVQEAGPSQSGMTNMIYMIWCALELITHFCRFW